jgi:hypothetical protein
MLEAASCLVGVSIFYTASVGLGAQRIFCQIGSKIF